MTLSGTPPRLDGRTIDYTDMEVHPPDDEPVPFSFLNEYNGVTLAGGQVPCHMTHTNPQTHQIITENQHLNRHVMEEVTGPRWVELGRGLLPW